MAMHCRGAQRNKHYALLTIIYAKYTRTTMSDIQCVVVSLLHFFCFVSQAPFNSTELQNYNRGVQMGCWGLVVYAATAAACSGKTQCPLVD